MNIINLTIKGSTNQYAIASLVFLQPHDFAITFLHSQDANLLDLIKVLISSCVDFDVTISEIDYTINFQCDDCTYELDNHQTLLNQISSLTFVIHDQDVAIERLEANLDILDVAIEGLDAKPLHNALFTKHSLKALEAERASLKESLKLIQNERNENLKLYAEYKQQLEQLKFNKNKAK